MINIVTPRKPILTPPKKQKNRNVFKPTYGLSLAGNSNVKNVTSSLFPEYRYNPSKNNVKQPRFNFNLGGLGLGGFGSLGLGNLNTLGSVGLRGSKAMLGHANPTPFGQGPGGFSLGSFGFGGISL